MILFVGNVSFAQKSTDKDTKEERKYHDKQNSKFVTQVKSLQEQIKEIRQDKSLSKEERKEKIRPLFEEMKAIRQMNVADRKWDDDEEVVASDTDRQKPSKLRSDKSPKSDRKQIKRLQKEISKIKKDSSLSEAEKRAKLDPIQRELLALKTGKKLGKERVPGPKGRMLKKDIAKQEVNHSEREQWKAERAAKRKATMEKELDNRKIERQKAREKREKNIEEWKAKARQEKKDMSPVKPSMSAPVVTAPDKSMSSEAKPKTEAKMETKEMDHSTPSNVMKPDPLDISTEPIHAKSAKKSVIKSKMLNRLTAMSDRLMALNDSGLINAVHFEKKMAHIRKLRERFLKM